ncbi:pro-sigmaK processing inhibitor BofA family protein [Oceanobacillus sp. J11TS1]|uniref:pro-sigmaK processing inhibitor BofA family protein n=1 Tax=Oceanobacillus sp. J11TS1 TaxID=2807191 RepID=UPI001B07C9C3|nr:pro-sigmaK processing inhibitor BofA family protein [Oceanobacillus sp. J11TS1]GIO24269.1 sigma-K factor-processing regulatory protein BofA [Oceanobacillus sp. J11TS1]
MSSTLVIGFIIGLIIILFIVGAPVKPMKYIGKATIRLGIGALLLFFLNVFGGVIGLHIPINLFTVLVSGFLGVFGVGSLAAIHLFIL